METTFDKFITNNPEQKALIRILPAGLCAGRFFCFAICITHDKILKHHQETGFSHDPEIFLW